LAIRASTDTAFPIFTFQLAHQLPFTRTTVLMLMGLSLLQTSFLAPRPSRKQLNLN